MMPQVLGIDFDNTIVCYDEVFHRVALERDLIPQDLPQTKEQVRDYLRRVGQEDEWTEMQGYVYGSRMADVKPFPGALECIAAAVKAGFDVAIISHKTKVPYRGHPYDLHKSARGWLEQHGVMDADQIGVSADKVFFLETKRLKLEQIGKVGCTRFIDDLPEFLLEEGFSEGVERILFDPAKSVSGSAANSLKRFSAWGEIRSYLGLS